MVRDAAPDVIGVIFGLPEEGGHVVIVESILDFMVSPADRLYETAIAQ
jgi:hypothetical protein